MLTDVVGTSVTWCCNGRHTYVIYTEWIIVVHANVHVYSWILYTVTLHMYRVYMYIHTYKHHIHISMYIHVYIYIYTQYIITITIYTRMIYGYVCKSKACWLCSSPRGAHLRRRCSSTWLGLTGTVSNGSNRVSLQGHNQYVSIYIYIYIHVTYI